MTKPTREERDKPLGEFVEALLPSCEELMAKLHAKFATDQLNARVIVWQAIRKKYLF